MDWSEALAVNPDREWCSQAVRATIGEPAEMNLYELDFAKTIRFEIRGPRGTLGGEYRGPWPIIDAVDVWAHHWREIRRCLEERRG